MRKEENIENIEKEDLCSKLQVHREYRGGKVGRGYRIDRSDFN